MNWEPISLNDLDQLVASELAECSDEQRAMFAASSFAPTKWKLSPWGDQGGGFWALATLNDRVLWYNDIEGGWNVSRFDVHGEIPDNEYWCNQDPMKGALPNLAGATGSKLGPPRQT